MTPLERFEKHYITEPNTGCWLWLGSLDNDGYGRLRINRTIQLLCHRFSYQAFVGPIPEGLTIDHLCRVRSCVNPQHLQPVTIRVNTHRGETVNKVNASKTHCPNGHPYDVTNKQKRRSRYVMARRCRICVNAQARRRWAELQLCS